jgi:hypothetical protein
MSLLEQGLHREAAATIDATAPAEPWEAVVAAILRAYCQQRATSAAPGETGNAIAKTLELIRQGEPTTAAFRSRAGLTALDLAASQPEEGTAQLRDAIVKLAATDAYAARNALGPQHDARPDDPPPGTTAHQPTVGRDDARRFLVSCAASAPGHAQDLGNGSPGAAASQTCSAGSPTSAQSAL